MLGLLVAGDLLRAVCIYHAILSDEIASSDAGSPADKDSEDEIESESEDNEDIQKEYDIFFEIPPYRHMLKSSGCRAWLNICYFVLNIAEEQKPCYSAGIQL